MCRAGAEVRALSVSRARPKLRSYGSIRGQGDPVSGPVHVTETNSLELIVGNDFFGLLTWNCSGLRWIQSGLRKMKIFDFEIRLCTSGDCRSGIETVADRHTVQTADVGGESD